MRTIFWSIRAHIARMNCKYKKMKLINQIKILIWTAATSLIFTACLGDNEGAETVVTDYYNTIVTSFALVDNADVASNLSKYNFTIDNYGTSDAAIHEKFPNDGIIFNADSLPYGTIADSIKVTVSYSAPDSAYFCLHTYDGKLRQYSNVSGDSALYFASFPDVRLHIAARGNHKVYHVKINVHKINSDSIKWRSYTDELWGDTFITDQRTDTIGSTAYWFAETVTGNQVITSDLKSKFKEWTAPAAVSVEGNELLNLQTLYSWHNALYAISKNSNALLTSVDGYNWQIANKDYEFVNILGNQLATKDVFGTWNSDTLNMIVHYEDAYHFAVSANAKDWRIDKVIPRNFPISGYSRPISVAARPNNGNLTSRIYIVGGKVADGRSLSSSTWSCDGYNEDESGCNWAEFPHGNLPAMQGGSVIEYALDNDHPKSFWILLPGFNTDGSIQQATHYGRNYATLYYSEDYGVSWHNLYSKYPKMADNSAFANYVSNSVICDPNDYEIYFFGGKASDGTCFSKVWGGVLPSLSFIKVR